MTRSASPVRLRLVPEELVRIRRFIASPLRTKQNGRCERRQLNVLSARYVETQITRTRSRKNSRLRGILRLFAVGVALGRACQNLLGDQAGILPDGRFDLRGHVGIGFQERFRILAALAEALAVIGEPGAGFLDDAGLDAEIENFAHLGDALAIHDVEILDLGVKAGIVEKSGAWFSYDSHRLGQ